MSYERLMREHARIEIAVQHLLELVSAPEPDLGCVTIALSDLSQELSEHLAHEDSFIYPRMIQGNNALMRDAARAFSAEFASLRDDWSLYLREWSAECIGGDWAHFVQQTKAILERLQCRIDAENNILYTAALRESVIMLRESYAA
ncbi:MAG: hemerythrin domain-containing protein [Sphingomonadales bacterium]|nr:MAG: hemerythrin domain-containing protein [Sphingomonadales bacterium]